MELIDIGVNLTSKRFDRDRDAILDRAREAGVQAMIITGTTPQASVEAVELAEQHPHLLYATAGMHPHTARDLDRSALEQIRELLDAPQVVAAGEMGLDFNRDFSPRPQQEHALEQQLQLAAASGKPVFIHQRDAHARLHAILKSCRDSLTDAVVHCFTDNRRALYDYLDLDLHIGVTGWICDDRRGKELRELVREIPENRLMIETDAPYLVPRDLEPAPPGGRNEPAFLPHVLAAIAHFRQQPVEMLAATTTENARRFFRLPGGAGRNRS